MAEAMEATGEEKPVKVKTKFLQVLKDSDSSAFLEFADQHKSKRSPFTFEQLLSSFNGDELVESWKGILNMVQKHTEIALQVDKSVQSSDVEKSTNVIQTAAHIGVITFDHLSKVPVHMLQMILFLHDVLLSFSSSQEVAQDMISKLCERFWVNDVDGKEELVANTIIYLLKRTLNVKFKKNDVKRVYLIKDCIKTVLDMENADKELLQFYLKQCVTSSSYLSMPEGVKFIEFVLCLSESTVLTYHDRIKLRFQRRTQRECRTYGTIYLHAWIHATTKNLLPLKEKLENDCIQDFIYHAVHVQRHRPKSLFPLLRKLLSVFTEKRKDFKVSKMLRTLFEPIIWRALKNANGAVRANAADIFFDFFPLEDPTMNIAETELEVQRQLLLVKDLLYDEYPVVRAIAAVGVCLVMAYNWELLSTDIVKTYFKILIDDLSLDSSSADVRCAVIKGLKVLVTEGNEAIPHLKIVLPKFRGMFHDVSSKVRILFCQLLLAVKKVRFIKYWEIVPEDHILARMEEDRPVVQRLLVELMYNSYLPEKQSPAVWIARCIELVKKSPVVSKVFFRHLCHCAKFEAVVKLMFSVCQVLQVHISGKLKKVKTSSRKAANSDKENCGNNEEVEESCDAIASLDDPDVVAGLLDGMALLWLSIQGDLEKPENRMSKKELIARCSMCMPPLLKYFKNSEIWKQVYFLCAFVPASFIPMLSDLCFERLMELQMDVNIDDYRVLFVCLCYHEKTDELIQFIRQWIHYGVSPNKLNPAKRKAKRKKTSHFDGVIPKPMLAVRFLELLINDPLCQKAVLKSDFIEEVVSGELDCVQKAIEDCKSSLDDEDKKNFLSRCFSVLTRWVVLLQIKRANSDELLLKILSWADENVLVADSSAVPIAGNKRRSRSSKVLAAPSSSWKELGCTLWKDLLSISSDVVLVVNTSETAVHYLQFAKHALDSEYGPGLIFLCATLGCRLLKNNKLPADVDKEIENYFALFQELFHSIYKLVSKEKFFSGIPAEHKDKLKTELKEYFSSLMKSKSVPSESKENLVSSMFSCVIDNLSGTVEKIGPDVSASGFPPAAAILLSVITGTERLKFISLLLKQVEESSLVKVVSTCWLLAEIIQNNPNLMKKLDKDIRKATVEFHNTFDEFRSKQITEREKAALDHGKTKIEAIMTLFQNE